MNLSSSPITLATSKRLTRNTPSAHASDTDSLLRERSGVRLYRKIEMTAPEDRPAIRLTARDMRVRRAVINIHVFNSFLAIIAATVILVAMVFRVPMTPVSGHWPSYGLVFLIPSLMRILIGYFAEKATGASHMALVLSICAGLTLLDLYALVALVAWIYGYVSQTLSPTVFHEFSVGGHLMITFCYLFVVALSVYVVVNCITAFLLLQFGIKKGGGKSL